MKIGQPIKRYRVTPNALPVEPPKREKPETEPTKKETEKERG